MIHYYGQVLAICTPRGPVQYTEGNFFKFCICIGFFEKTVLRSLREFSLNFVKTWCVENSSSFSQVFRLGNESLRTLFLIDLRCAYFSLKVFLPRPFNISTCKHLCEKRHPIFSTSLCNIFKFFGCWNIAYGGSPLYRGGRGQIVSVIAEAVFHVSPPFFLAFFYYIYPLAWEKSSGWKLYYLPPK